MEKWLRDYEIDILSLKNKEYQFSFICTTDFFSRFQETLTNEGEVEAKLRLLKSETMLQLFFNLEGFLNLVCDVSLEPFSFPLKTENKLILKFGEESEVVDENFEVIPFHATSINVAQYIYEFISIAIPYKKLHPNLQENESESEEDLVLFYSSQSETEEETTEVSEEENQWKLLESLKEKFKQN